MPDITLSEVEAERIISLPKGVHGQNIWQRRVSMLSCFYFIRKNDFRDALQIAGALVDDREDLIHKAVGWMLREIGKRDLEAEERFLEKHCHVMPRTMLRYAIERFDPEKRQVYMQAEKRGERG